MSGYYVDTLVDNTGRAVLGVSVEVPDGFTGTVRGNTLVIEGGVGGAEVTFTTTDPFGEEIEHTETLLDGTLPLEWMSTDLATDAELAAALEGVGGSGEHPDLAGHNTLGLATQAELDAEATTRAAADTALDGRVDTLEAAETVAAHAADTSNVHGIADTSVLATDAEVASAVAAESAARAAAVTAASTTDRDRANHTGTQSLDTTTDSATRLAFLAAERTKLAGVETGATANSTDATLFARANHTGVQAISTVTDLQSTLDAKALGSETWKYRGAWAASTAYAVNDVVRQIGGFWLRASAGTSGSVFDPTNWLPLGEPFVGASGDLLATGEENIERDRVSAVNVSVNAGVLRLTYFTARKSETVGRIRMRAGTAAAVGSTLTKMALFEEDPSTGDLTRIGVTASDTTLFSSTHTEYERVFTASATKTAGKRYATGVLSVGPSTAANFYGVQPNNNFSATLARAPRLGGQINGQTDIPSSITVASIVDIAGIVYAEVAA